MALVEVNWRPSPKELRVFAILLIVFFGIVAWVIAARFDAPAIGLAVWAIAAALAVIGFVAPNLLWPLYVVWMAAALPIGWIVSHIIMALVFYLVITPIGLMMRICGRDPMERRFDDETSSYWKRRRDESETRRYFRQY